MSEVQFAGFGHQSGLGKKPAIIVVDFIKGFTDQSSPLGSDLENEIDAAKKLLDLARQASVLTIFTTVVYEPGYQDGAYFIQKIPALKILTESSGMIEVDPRLERNAQSEILITKKFASAFFGTNLSSILAYERIDTAIIIGCTTSGCIRATAVDAVQHGYRVVIPKECVGDRSKSAHDANLYDIQTKYGDVVSVETVKEYLLNMKGDRRNHV